MQFNLMFIFILIDKIQVFKMKINPKLVTHSKVERKKKKENPQNRRIRTVQPQTELLVFPSWLGRNKAGVMLIYTVISMEIKE